MLMRLNRKGQSTGEYAIVFALVLGAVIGMQAYVRRGLQQGVKMGSDTLVAKEYYDLNTDLSQYGAEYALEAPADGGYAVRAAAQTSDAITSETIAYHQTDGEDFRRTIDDQTGIRAGSVTMYDYDGVPEVPTTP